MNWNDCKLIIKSDCYRHGDNLSYFKLKPGARFSVLFRWCAYLRTRHILRPLYYVSYCIYSHISIKYGIDIPVNTRIGYGFYIGHHGAITVNEMVVIGNNVNISQGVTIGQTNRGERKGVPTIGDDVYIGPGAKVIGKIKIGNNVAIGANAVVTHDVPDNAVVVGVPARVISMDGSAGYVERKWCISDQVL